MSDLPSVSVILPVLNGGHLLSMAVGSIVRQSFSDWELLIIDDGSDDGCTGFLQDLQDDRIILIKDGRNVGLAARLNQGVHLARGKYIARMDHDDVCHRDRLRKQICFLECHPAIDLLATASVVIDSLGRLHGLLPFHREHHQLCASPWKAIYMAHPTWMGRRTWFLQHPYADPAPYRCEDQELLLRAHEHSTYACLADALLAYRVNGDDGRLKRIKTSMALIRMRCGYFWQKRKFFAFVRSASWGIARLVRDCIGVSNSLFSSGKFRAASQPASAQVYEFWKREPLVQGRYSKRDGC